MQLSERIAQTFGNRLKPATVTDPIDHLQLDSDIEDTLWFKGREWREISREDWQKRSAALSYFSKEAFVYYLPSVMLLAIAYPCERLLPVQTLIWELDKAPNRDEWDPRFVDRFLNLSNEEYEILKEWLVEISNCTAYRGRRLAGAGVGETLGRAFDTVVLLQEEANRKRLKRDEL